MFPLKYENIYMSPESGDHVKAPEDFELSSNTHFPNLNSRDYAKQPLNHTNRMYDVWECIDRSVPNGNCSENVVICCNKNSGRDFKSSAWGFYLEDLVCGIEASENPVKEENACFKLQCDDLITHMVYVSPTNFLLALNNGVLQLWSTCISTTPQKKNFYCLFRTEEKTQQGRLITSICKCQNNPLKTLTGHKNGTLKIWNISENDLDLEQTYRFAHLDEITGIASAPGTEHLFATCSLDKSLLLWDRQQTRPAIALIEPYETRFKAITWSNDENLLYAGDEAGYILTLDKRVPKQYLHKQRYFNRSIRKLSVQGDHLAVIADSNVIKVSRSVGSNQDQNIFYTDSKSKHFLRDCLWLQKDLIGVVGFAGKLDFHKLSPAIDQS